MEATVKTAYGTYALPTIPLEDAFRELAAIGYDGVEICIGPSHMGSMPAEMTPARRTELRQMLAGEGLGVPALFLLGSIYTESPEQHQANLAHARRCAELARDLGLREPPVLAMGFGGKRDAYEDLRGRMVELLGDYAAVAAQEDFVLAGEAHCGAALDRSERITSVLDEVADPRVRLHFDIVHLFLAGEGITEAVNTLLPYTAHTHITDAIRNTDGSFRLLLLGQGDLDSTEYVRAMKAGGWGDYITLEVSTMVWGRKDYVPLAAASFCYHVLKGAFARAGV